MEHSTVPRTHGMSWWHARPRRPIRIFLLMSRATMWWQTSPRRRSQRAQGPGSSWCRHGNREQRHTGPGLFTLPFWQASSATLKPIHCPPPPAPGLAPAPHRPLSPQPALPLHSLPPPLPPSLPQPPPAAFAKALEGESWAKEGLRFSILSRFPLHRQRALSCIFPLLS